LSAYDDYLDNLLERMQRLRADEAESLESAAEICTSAIGGGGLVHLFGTGHGSMPAMEAFPRTGSYVGWHPIVIEALGPHLRVGGEGSVHQFRYLQGAEGYGKAILDSYPIHEGDAFVISSHSGVNRVVMEVALAVKEAGHPLVAITSREHSSQATPRHNSGKRLSEVADVVLDNHAPFGDAVLALEGLEQRVAAVSTSLSMALVGALVASTAEHLLEQGVEPLVLGHIDLAGNRIPDEMRRDYVQAFQNRLWRRDT